MKPGLRRIEATLGQLIEDDMPDGRADENAAPHPTSPSISKTSANSSGASKTSANQTRGKKNSGTAQARSKAQAIEPFPLPKHSPEAVSVSGTVAAQATSAQDVFTDVGTLPQASQAIPVTVQPFPVQGACPEMPALPRSKPAIISSHRHAANPNLAVGLLKEIETLVRGWQKELEQIVQQIQALYQEGPIVDGWLESYAPNGQHSCSPLSVSTLRHAEIDHLMEFIEQICSSDQAQLLDDLPRTNYRLCGLDPDGKIWSRPCPSEQVPYVGLAIARYQKLRTLFAKKQSLENRLMGLVETLTMLHGQIRD